jgi:hypothetical protein
MIDNPDTDDLLRKEPHRVVRVTLEMFSNQKLNERLKGDISKKDLKKFIEAIEEEGDV